MRNIKFSTGEYYHIYNRGVEKRKIFLDESDYFRFLVGVKEFSEYIKFESKPCEKNCAMKPIGSENSNIIVVCYCLMPNHFHFIIQQLRDGGITDFMHRLSTGYAMYFNRKYDRTGVLFQGVFKAKHIAEDSYILHLSRYIHQNPLEISGEDIDNKSSRGFIETYKWSSLRSYLDRNKPCVFKLNREIILGQFKNINEYRDFVLDFEAKPPQGEALYDCMKA